VPPLAFDDPVRPRIWALQPLCLFVTAHLFYVCDNFQSLQRCFKGLRLSQGGGRDEMTKIEQFASDTKKPTLLEEQICCPVGKAKFTRSSYKF
jgi:hypothetical protein